ncbi:unnamed protein product [Somion occarium]|uniref:Methyltransferase domain-containing protein n=1 Tax=Somion occarium TaxID=3059160 RepID=A0ABP1E052_9APHY
MLLMADRLDQVTSFLRRPDVNLCFQIHPNQLTIPTFNPPAEWNYWWQWSGEPMNASFTSNVLWSQSKWQLLWFYYVRDSTPDWIREHPDEDTFKLIPIQLRKLIDEARTLQLSRAVDTFGRQSTRRKFTGMSPKKAHEVERMTQYVSNVLAEDSPESRPQHAADIGAGQAYLSRSLRDELGLHVLALDFSQVQSHGAARREQASKSSDNETQAGSLDYEMIAVDSNSLISATEHWIQRRVHGCCLNPCPTPILWVALHACGSLTLDILRAFILRRRQNDQDVCWRPSAAVIVGCCYNMVRSEDRVLTRDDIVLSPNHLQLAAQTPDQWGTSPLKFDETVLAIRKIVWRALLEGIMARSEVTQTDPAAKLEIRRLGRLNNDAYTDRDQFIRRAQTRMGVDLSSQCSLSERDENLERRLEVFHVLRCILGPVAETFILLDRERWLNEQLELTCSTKIRAVQGM